jgi:hypothetical protein
MMAELHASDTTVSLRAVEDDRWLFFTGTEASNPMSSCGECAGNLTSGRIHR